MGGRNNIKLRQDKQSDKIYKYAIKKLSVGVASIAVSTGLLFLGPTSVSAAETPASPDNGAVETEGSSESTNPVEEANGVASIQEALTAEDRAKLQSAGYTEEEIEKMNLFVREQMGANPAFNKDNYVSEQIAAKAVMYNNPASGPALQAPLANNQKYKAASKNERVNYRYGKVGDPKLAIDPENLKQLPKNTKFEWVDNNVFNFVGDQIVKLKVIYPDQTEEIIKVAISVNNAYELNGVKHSGTMASQETRPAVKVNGQLNIGIKMNDLVSNESRNKKTIGMDMSAMYGGGITAEGRHKMVAYLELDDRIARHVTRIDGSRDGAGAYNYTWERVVNSKGELTNSWRLKAFSMLAEPGKDGRKTLFVGDSPEVKRVNNGNKIHLDKTIKQILDTEGLNIEQGDLIYNFYILDGEGRIQNQTLAHGIFKLAPSSSDTLPAATAVNNKNWFSNSHGVVNYQPNAGRNGGFSFDQYLNKDSRGTLNNYRDIQNREWAYRFKIDERLLPYVESVDGYFFEGSLINGFNSKDFKRDNKFKDYWAKAPQGLGGRGREGWVNFEMRFNPGKGRAIQSEYTAAPDGSSQGGLSGQRALIAWFDTRNGDRDKQNYRYNNLKPGEGYFTLDNAPINFGSEQVNFSNGTTQAAVVRIVVNLKKGVDLNKILGDQKNKDTNYGLTGYFVNSKNELIPGTISSGYIEVVDSDGDGKADDIDNEINTPIRKSDTEKYNPDGQDVTTSLNTIPDARLGVKEKVVQPTNPKEPRKHKLSQLPPNTKFHWEVTPDVSKEGTFPNAVIITYPDGTTDRVVSNITVRADNRVYEPSYTQVGGKVGTLVKTGEPTFTKDGKKSTKPVGATFKIGDNAPAGATVDSNTGIVSYTPAIADSGQLVKVPVVVTYPDGTEDNVTAPIQVELKLTVEATPKTQTKVEGKNGTVINPITVTKNKDDATIKVDNPNLTVGPNGQITGTLPKQNWGPTEEEKDIPVKITVTRPGEEPVETTVTVRVQRDTDGDGNPDVTDTDDDGDGIPDKQDENPKVPDNLTVTATPKSQTQVEGPNGTTIDPITVTTSKTDGKITVDNPNLTVGPNGQITGTLPKQDWGPTEEEKDIPVKITVTRPGEEPVETTVTVKVQRDTDGDGNPDVTDPDDDGDGIPDKQDENPKVPDNVTVTATPKSQTKVEGPNGTTIDPITVTTSKTDGTITVDQPGLTVNGDGTITGTLPKQNWGPTEEEKDIPVKITVTRPGEEPIETTVTVKVQRDTDGDGNPDVTDPDDDGDGFPDKEEIDKGSDPKDPNSIPAKVVTPIGKTTITNKDQTIVEDSPISDVVITPENDKAKVTVDETKLPEGVTYNPDTKTISGTPKVPDWGNDEKERTIEITVTTENPDGSKRTDKVTIKVQRKKDADKYPVVIPAEKTPVEDLDQLTGMERVLVEDKVKKVNPKATEVTVDKNGNATLTYPDGSTNTIPAEKLVYEIEKGNPAIAYPIESHPIEKFVGDKLTEKEITDAIVVVGRGKDQYTVSIKAGQTLPTTDKAGDAIVDVTITYADGTTDDAQVWVIIKAKQADVIKPVLEAKGEPGTTVPVQNTGDPLPEGTKVEGKGITQRPDGSLTVDIPEDAKVGEVIEIPVTITYPDGSTKEEVVRVTVTGPSRIVPTRKLSVKQASALPKTGDAGSYSIFGAAALSILTGLGLITADRKKEDDE